MNRWLQNATFTRDDEDSRKLPNLEKAKEKVERKWARNLQNTAKLSDFELVRTLGSGTFGRVMMVRYIVTMNKPYYAMKIMAKRKVIRANSVRHVINEKRILQAVKFPFIVNYMYNFKDNANVFLVMEYAPGGDMFTHLKRLGKFEEELASFYAGQVGLAFEYLHYAGIVYRDLKPENVVIDKSGYLKITDFGFAKKIDNKNTTTMCGTPEYYAPEIVKNQSYSFSVDWWTLGVLIYEMSYGRPPFRASNVLKLFQLILDNNAEFPDHFSASTKSIIESLMKTERSMRINSAQELKKHKYFENIEWMQLYRKKKEPPYVPNVWSENDTHNFEKQGEEKIEEFSEDVYAEEFKQF